MSFFESKKLDINVRLKPKLIDHKHFFPKLWILVQSLWLVQISTIVSTLEMLEMQSAPENHKMW